jgi:hypothetical protein
MAGNVAGGRGAGVTMDVAAIDLIADWISGSR